MMRQKALTGAAGRVSPYPRPPPCRLDALPHDVLYNIFNCLDESSRLRYLPLVCRRFATLLRRPGACWRCLTFEGRRWPHDESAELHRLLGFLRWAAPRAGSLLPAGPGVHALQLTMPPAAQLGGELLQHIEAVLHAAAPTLRQLDLRCALPLHVGTLLPDHVQQRMTALTRLELVGEAGIAAVRLGQLTALQRLYLVDDSDLPCPLDEASILPPSITWLGLTPAPMGEQPGGPHALHIPECVLALQALRFLDVSESPFLAGLEGALPRLTGLTALVLDHAGFNELPPQLSLLTRLRLLSLHGALQPQHAGPISFAPLAALHDMRVLSLSECPRMRELPPAVVGLPNLRALHVEKCGLEALPAGLHLLHCKMLSIDWRVLLASHRMLPRLPALQQLILGDTAVPDQPPEEGTAAADAVVASLARCAALRRISVLIYPDSPLTLEAAAIMLTLPRRCRGLHLAAVSHTQFFLTDSEDLASEA